MAALAPTPVLPEVHPVGALSAQLRRPRPQSATSAKRRNRSKRAARKPPNGSSPADCAARLATLTIVAAWIDDRDIPERSDAGIAFGIFRSPTVDASRFIPSLPLRLAPAAKRSTPLFVFANSKSFSFRSPSHWPMPKV